MKKINKLIVILASTIFKNAEGQDINIAGQEISFVILIPLIFMVILIIIFAIMFLKDSRPYQNPVQNKVAQKIQEKPKEEKELPKLWVNYLEIIDTFVQRLEDKEVQPAFDSFIKILREFFKDRFNLNYEFTYDELLNEFKKIDFSKTELIKYLQNLTYRDEPITKKKVYDMAMQLTELIKIIDKRKLDELNSSKINEEFKLFGKNNLLKTIKRKEEEFDNRLNKFVILEKNRLFKRKTAKEPELKHEYNEDKLEQINQLILKGKEALENNDVPKLKEIYSDLSYLFPFLSEQSKKIAYLKILEFYGEINNKLSPQFFQKIKK